MTLQHHAPAPSDSACAGSHEPRQRTCAPKDAWQAAVAAFVQRVEPMPGWPMDRRRAVRLEDDEPHDAELEARIERLMASLPHDLPEADRRILDALARHGDSSQRGLARQLDMDRAYLSRRLRKLAEAQRVLRTESAWRLG